MTRAAVSRRRISPVCCTLLTCTRSSADIVARSFSTSVSRELNLSRLSLTGDISCSVALSRRSACASAALPCRSRVSADSTLNWFSIASRSAAISLARSIAAFRSATALATSADTSAASAWAPAASARASDTSDRASAASARACAASARAVAASLRDWAISVWAWARSVLVCARWASVRAVSVSRRARATCTPARPPTRAPTTSPQSRAKTVIPSMGSILPRATDNLALPRGRRG